jgi:Nif-specific regulatory protein
VGEFLRNSEMAKDKGINRLSNRRLSQLMSYQWPGNVRELGNVIERAILRTSGAVIREVDLPGTRASAARRRRATTAASPATTSKCPLKEYLRRAEKDYLARVLRKYVAGSTSPRSTRWSMQATLHRKNEAPWTSP